LSTKTRKTRLQKPSSYSSSWGPQIARIKMLVTLAFYIFELLTVTNKQRRCLYSKRIKHTAKRTQSLLCLIQNARAFELLSLVV
jgi:hypothetical protein